MTTFVAAAHSVDNSSVSSLACNKPTGTADNDIMFALVKRNDSTAPSGVPTGWTLLGDRVPGGANSFWLYYKVAASEGTSYTWTWGAAGRTGITIVSYRDGFDTADPIDIVSNTSYVTNDTTNRAASVSATAANSPIIFFGGVHVSASVTSTPPSAPSAMTEDVDYYDNAGRFARQVASVVWTGSGATGDMDATISSTQADKHAFAVVLNPSAGGGASRVNLLRGKLGFPLSGKL